MRIVGYGGETYIYVSGLIVSDAIPLGEKITLLPAALPDNREFYNATKSNLDLGMFLMYENLIHSQLHIIEKDPKELARISCFAVWDLFIISALFNCEAAATFQCNVPAERLTCNSDINATNYHMYGLHYPLHTLTQDESKYLQDNIEAARVLMEHHEFMTAIHCLASYRWHNGQNVQLAVIWTGIESLFNIESEISFRLSFCIAKFLEPNDVDKAKSLFDLLRKLYRARSIVVHGSFSSSSRTQIHPLNESVVILQRILKRCIEIGELPNMNDIIFSNWESLSEEERR